MQRPTMIQSPRSSRRPQLRSTTLDIENYNAMARNSRGMPPRVPAPSHRHGTPSGPWPFLDLDDNIDPEQLKNKECPEPFICDHQDPAKCNRCWSRYPQSLFPNWTPSQQQRSQISRIVGYSDGTCIIHYVDVAQDGKFTALEKVKVEYSERDKHWRFMTQPRPERTKIRAMFIENLTGPVLQMVGTKYNVEPFFFSSSLGWIPSRYQEEVKPKEGDHITICLTFIRTMRNPTTLTSPTLADTESTTNLPEEEISKQVIDTQAPLYIRSVDQILLSDLLALHMVRNPNGSTIISYHPGKEHRTTTASSLHSRLGGAGRSVYWNNIFSRHNDPTFVFLSILWYALYAWDEALEILYSHICWLESSVIHTNDINLTQELHVIQAHLLHYESLLSDFHKTVVFVLDTPYPALDNPSLYSDEERSQSQALMKSECMNLLLEIERLERSQTMQGRRLKNVMNLGFSSVNIEESKYTQNLTAAAAKDSAAMKQVAYLSMFFLPASFVANVFGMNVHEINPQANISIIRYIITAIIMTVVTVWAVVALQFHPNHPWRTRASEDENSRRSMLWQTLGRIAWPAILAMELSARRKKERASRQKVP